MGLILDTSILIASERRGEGVEDILNRARTEHQEDDVAISSVSVVELTHGIYRARTEADKLRRQTFAEGIFENLIIHPVTHEIAELAGRI